VETLVMGLMTLILLIVLPVEEENEEGYGYELGFDVSFANFDSHLFAAADGQSSEYKRAFVKKYPYIMVILLFINAYLVAALVEELCKYFGFKIVEHPDFLTETEIHKAAARGVPENKRRMHCERDEWGGGLDCIGDLDCVQSDSNLSMYDSDEENYNSNSKKDLLDRSNSGIYAVPANIPVELIDCPRRDVQTIGSAITVAMVAVALGFACCENLIYIFFRSGSDLNSEIAVLITRSLFPIHPLCAGKLPNLCFGLCID
jgi:hypothetical protein